MTEELYSSNNQNHWSGQGEDNAEDFRKIRSVELKRVANNLYAAANKIEIEFFFRNVVWKLFFMQQFWIFARYKNGVNNIIKDDNCKGKENNEPF